MKNEVWKDIEGYEGLYQVSNTGKVKSLGNDKSRKEKILKQGKHTDGYFQVSLFKNSKRKTFRVQCLVAKAFIPNPENKLEVNHKNEIKTDNRVENLEWCDHKYNINYGTRNERVSKILTNRKDNSKNVLCVETNIIYQSIMEAQRNTGISNTNISECCNGKRKTAGKLHWKYVK